MKKITRLNKTARSAIELLIDDLQMNDESPEVWEMRNTVKGLFVFNKHDYIKGFAVLNKNGYLRSTKNVKKIAGYVEVDYAAFKVCQDDRVRLARAHILKTIFEITNEGKCVGINPKFIERYIYRCNNFDKIVLEAEKL